MTIAPNLNAKRERGVLPRPTPAVSAVLDDGTVLETVLEPSTCRTAFALWRDGAWRIAPRFAAAPDRLWVPYEADNNLLRNEVVLLPSRPEEYRTTAELVSAIRAFIHRYVDVSPAFETIAASYVLLTWVYGAFHAVPYLRVRGDYGSGKSRFLETVGALCYLPIFASGASTVSPLFRILDAFRGTLVIDEGDFRISDEKAEIVKILNNGNTRGFPVLRSEQTGRGQEFNPRAYHVFGPKLVATRGPFEDRALESRCLTEQMGQARLREDIPIHLPAVHRDEALALRNRLLLFRFRNLSRVRLSEELVDRAIEPRLSQIFGPLVAITDDPQARAELQELARRTHRELVAERGLDAEAQVLEIVRDMLDSPFAARLPVKDITSWFIDRHGQDYEKKITTKWIGWLIRNKLGLKAIKAHGAFVIPGTEAAKLPRLYEKYGVGPAESAEATSPPAGGLHEERGGFRVDFIQ